MSKLKGFSRLLLAAILGGGISFLALRAFSPSSERASSYSPFARKASYDIKSVTVPTFDFVEVSELVTPTVVHIKTTVDAPAGGGRGRRGEITPFDFFEEFGGPSGPQMGSGSGVIISSDGYIVTNNHVVNGATTIDVILNDNRSYKGEVIGTDPNTDMALVKIDEKDLPSIKLGNSDDTRIGEWVLAVGNPFNLTSTVTAGIVSAKGRNIRLLGSPTAIESFIQTDAAVNPGNSGGALVNTKGELIGINTAIASQSGQYEGYSFAVPVNLMRKVIEDIKSFGEVQRGYLGVSIVDVNATIAKEKKLDQPRGVLIEKVNEESGAEKAGLKKGDVIMKVDDKSTFTVAQLQERIAQYRPGNKVTLEVIREGKTKTYTVTLLNKENKATLEMTPAKELKKNLGVELVPLTDVEKRARNLSQGVRVTEVKKGVFETAKIPVDFVITSIDKTRIFTPNDVYRILDGKTGGILVEGYAKDAKDKKYYVLEMGE